MLAAPGCDRAPRNTLAIVQEKSATNIAARISLDSDAITTAQRATLTIDTTTAPGWDPQPLDLSKSLPEGLTIVEALPEVRRGGDREPLALRRQYRLEPFLDGTYEIKPITLAARQRTTGERESAPIEQVTTDPITLKVASVLTSGDAELAGTKGVVDPVEPTPWVLIGLGAAALVAGSGAAAWFLSRRREPPPPAPVLVPAHELALRRLDALMARRLVEAGRFDPFYAEASWILRTYIEDRYGLHAPERTTEEFLQESRTSAVLTDDDVRVLERFMGHVDMVKFAAVVPSEREAQSVAGTVREFVERTRALDRLVEETPNEPGTDVTGLTAPPVASSEVAR